MFNNQIYGLTKGQYSPTSEVGQGHQVDAVRVARHAVQPDQPGARRRGQLRGPHPRHGPQAHDGDVPPGPRPQGRRLRRDLPELQRLQRRCVRDRSPARNAGDMLIPLDARRADPLRRRRRAVRRRSTPTARPASSRWPTSARTTSSCTTRPATTPAWPSCCQPAGPRPLRAHARSACSGPSTDPSTPPRPPSSSPPPRSAGPGDLEGLLHSGATWTVGDKN